MRTNTYFEVQVRPRRVAAVADPCDLLAARDLVTLRDQVFLVVRIDGDEVVVVRDEDEVAVPALLAGEEHHPLFRRAHRRALGTGEIDSVVVVALAGAEAGDEDSRRRPEQGFAVRRRVERPRSRPRDGGRAGPARRTRVDARER